MDILFINPSYFSPKEAKERYISSLNWIKGGNMYVYPFEPPLGLASIVSYLKTKGIHASILDLQALMLDDSEFVERLNTYKPPLIGISAMTPTLSAALRIAKIVKRTLPDSKIIFGGVHSTIEPDEILKNKEVDYVIRGEGEKTTERLFLYLYNGYGLKDLGICYKKDNELIINKKGEIIHDLDSTPMSDYDSFPIEKYIEYNRNLRDINGISMIVSRGCPYNCSFCAVKSTMGRKWRIKSPKTVVGEIEKLKDRYSIDGIWFKDSIFNLNRKWVLEFCGELNRKGVKVDWQCNTRVDLIKESIIKDMKRSGLIQVDVGIESGSIKSLKRLKKNISISQIKEGIKILKKYIRVSGFFMIGIPGETKEDIEMTFNLAKELNLDKYSWSKFIPLPGSDIYNKLLKEKKIRREDIKYDNMHFVETSESYCEVPPDELNSLYKEINDYFSKR
jgi:radical SAM superfamily enzyme YgiQ (UPF0313 family)